MNKKVSQLECEKKNSLDFTKELRDENTKLNEKKGNLQGELCEMKNKLSNLEHEYNDLPCKLKEKVSSLNHQLTMLEKEKIQLETELRKKVEELVVQLRIKSDEASSLKEELKKREKELSNDIKELEKKLYQLEREKKRLEGEVSYERQEHTRFKNEVDKLSTKEKKHLSKIEELEEALLSLKADEEELVNQSINVKDDYKKNVNKFEEKKREYVTKTVFTVLSVVKERVEQGLFNLEEQDMQDTDRIQEAVDEFMQPIYEKLGINNQLDISSEHSSEFKGTGENKLANGLTFPKPLSPHTSIPRRYLRKSLSPKKEDEDENKENSEQLNHESLDTNINSPHSSPFKDTTNNSYHTLKM
ncbi:hypothetical protein [Wolbachia endosymbiont (group A) of Bibio marci]|uniref:hypothetical protein n=1 Tax=Wolbachia endosymbiont (group A) of Bibio marci TaxID=2953987 RepID=UPI00223064F9|nr:hypothetical protein [Wolbachia endosymbiont (group A) of Bibio marci]